MSVISELIRVESDGTISFGDYTLATKEKLSGFKHNGGSYKVKTCQEITKLECNEMFVYESVPGTTVLNFNQEEGKVSFVVEGPESAQITLGLEAEAEYEIAINGESAGTMKTNLGAKLSLSVELEGEAGVLITVEKR